MVARAWEAVQGGATIQGPDHDISAESGLTREQFVGEYIEALHDLLATYDFIDLDGDGAFESAPTAEQNTLVLDLNADLTDLLDRSTGDLGPTPGTWIVYSGESKTPLQVVAETGPQLSAGLENEILPFGEFFGHVPGPSEVWYRDVKPDASGDGTVATVSSWGLYQGASAPAIALRLRCTPLMPYPLCGGTPGGTQFQESTNPRRVLRKVDCARGWG